MERRHSFWLKLVIGLAVVVAIVGLGLVGVSVALWRVKSSDAARAAAVLQASAAAVGLLATAALVGITAYYAFVTGEILRRSGPDIHVELKRGWTDGASGVITVPLDGRADTAPEPNFPQPVWALAIRNAGGAAVTIERAGLELHGNSMTYRPTQTLGTPLPHRLESHAAIDLYFATPAGALTRSADFFKVKKRARATVDLGSGETAVSEWRPMQPSA